VPVVVEQLGPHGQGPRHRDGDVGGELLEDVVTGQAVHVVDPLEPVAEPGNVLPLARHQSAERQSHPRAEIVIPRGAFDELRIHRRQDDALRPGTRGQPELGPQLEPAEHAEIHALPADPIGEGVHIVVVLGHDEDVARLGPGVEPLAVQATVGGEPADELGVTEVDLGAEQEHIEWLGIRLRERVAMDEVEPDERLNFSPVDPAALVYQPCSHPHEPAHELGCSAGRVGPDPAPVVKKEPVEPPCRVDTHAGHLLPEPARARRRIVQHHVRELPGQFPQRHAAHRC